MLLFLADNISFVLQSMQSTVHGILSYYQYSCVSCTPGISTNFNFPNPALCTCFSEIVKLICLQNTILINI